MYRRAALAALILIGVFAPIRGAHQDQEPLWNRVYIGGDLEDAHERDVWHISLDKLEGFRGLVMNPSPSGQFVIDTCQNAIMGLENWWLRISHKGIPSRGVSRKVIIPRNGERRPFLDGTRVIREKNTVPCLTNTESSPGLFGGGGFTISLQLFIDIVGENGNTETDDFIRNDFYSCFYIQCGGMTDIESLISDSNSDSSIPIFVLFVQRQITGWFYFGLNPRPLICLHFVQLLRHEFGLLNKRLTIDAIALPGQARLFGRGIAGYADKLTGKNCVQNEREKGCESDVVKTAIISPLPLLNKKSDKNQPDYKKRAVYVRRVGQFPTDPLSLITVIFGIFTGFVLQAYGWDMRDSGDGRWSVFVICGAFFCGWCGIGSLFVADPVGLLLRMGFFGT